MVYVAVVAYKLYGSLNVDIDFHFQIQFRSELAFILIKIRAINRGAARGTDTKHCSPLYTCQSTHERDDTQLVERMGRLTLGALIFGVMMLKAGLMKLRASQVDISIELDGMPVHVGPSFGASQDRAAAAFACSRLETPGLCEQAVERRLNDVRQVQVGHLSSGHHFLSLAVGMVSYTRIQTESGSFPMFIHPAKSPAAALREFSTMYQPFINMRDLVELSKNEDRVKHSLHLLNSATLEVCYVVLPSAIIGVTLGTLIYWVQGEKKSGVKVDLRSETADCYFAAYRDGFETLKWSLCVLVVLGHSFELSNSTPDVFQLLMGLPLSTTACSSLFFLSGVSSAAALRSANMQSRTVKDFLLSRLSRLFKYAVLTLALVSGLRKGLAPSIDVILKTCVAQFIEWNAVASSSGMVHDGTRFQRQDKEPFAASLWTVGLTVLCWTLAATMHGIGRVFPASRVSKSLLTTVPLISINSSLLATGCNFHVTSFFLGCLVVAIARDYKIKRSSLQQTILHPAFILATIPWASIVLHQTRPKWFMVSFFLCLLRSASTQVLSQPPDFFKTYLRGTVVGIYFFSSATQRWAIDSFPHHFSKQPWKLFLAALVLSVPVARSLKSCSHLSNTHSVMAQETKNSLNQSIKKEI